MLTRRLLTLVPLVVIAVLLQSAFWVPTYERQDVAGEERLRTFIEGSIGDAKILNPIVSADGASSDINALVFDGLLDLDEEQNWIGGLAERWETSSLAYLAVLPERRLPDGRPATASAARARLQQALETLPELAAEVRSLSVLPAETRHQVLTVMAPAEDGAPALREVEVRVDVPERVRFELARVVPDLAERIEPVLGGALLDPAGVAERLSTEDPADLALVQGREAELLSVLEHNPVMVFHLRRGVRFHDGHVLDAGDVVFTYQAYVDPKNTSPRASTWEPVKSVTALDDHTVRVVYKRLYSPATVAWSTAILPEHLLGDEALAREMEARGIELEEGRVFGLRESRLARNPIGTGPFRFVEWQGDEYIHLARFDDYWKGPAEYENYYYRIIPETVTQEVEFRSGGIDAYAALPYQVARYREDDRYHALSAVGNSYAYVGYNLRRPLFRDARVRRALGMAIDVDAIIEYVLYGEGDRVTGPYYRNTPYYNHETPELPYDPEGARALLAEAGWTPGPDGILTKDGKRLAFSLATNNGNPQRKAIVTIAQNSWKQLGIEVTTQLVEWTVFLEQVNEHEFDALVMGWGGGGLDPDLYQLWHSSQTLPRRLNFVGYESAVADALIERIRETYDHDEQRELAWQLHERIAEDQPYTFLYSGRGTLVLDRKIVRVEREGGEERYLRVEPTSWGSIKFHFNKWRKLAEAPVFEEAS